ncbi:zinc finger BED domain-containing protein 4-like [Frankliniella occidentalis]|uniref:Zinc finger BED domain-containing protein 4-like n=1 Tax=Frankliniella occidentalis TaxID=133901 RepID=A0A9C6XST0_FRAOC|nr:zinc finger BED domain-containing protein 4-like [Frankliniella occidentalis]
MAPPKSAAWKHFTKLSKTEAKCTICGGVVKTSGNTSNLWLHLEGHGIKKSKNASSTNSEDLIDLDDPVVALDDDNSNDGSVASTSSGTRPLPSPTLLGKRKRSFDSASSMTSPPKQATLDETLQRAGSFKAGGQRAKELDQAFLYMCMKDNMPLSSGDKVGMQVFTKQAAPLWKPPSRGRLTTMMEVNFLGVTAHFPIGTEMETVVLGLRLLTESHTAEYLATQFDEILAEWKIEKKKVSAVVTDNAENMKATVRLAFGPDKQLGCFAHTINLIPKAGLGCKRVNNKNVPNVPGLPELVASVKNIVSYSHRSYNFSNELKRLQAERGISEGKQLRLLQDCPTRWGSTYLMLDRFLDMAEIVTLAALKFPTEVVMLSATQLATLRLVRDLLRPFHEVTKEMSAEKSTTASKVIPMVTVLRKSIDNISAPLNDDIAKNFRKFIVDEFDRRFDQTESCMPLAIATLVDPRFMTTYFRNPLAVSRARTYVEDMVKKYIREEVTRAEENQAASTATEPAETNQQQKESGGLLWGEHDAMVAAAYVANSSDDPAGKARTEVRAFLGRPPAPRVSNPLEVWESIRHEYPHLYRVARLFLPMLGTSVPCERSFSDAGRIMTDDGNRLSAEHLKHRVFLYKLSDNIWYHNPDKK